MARKGEARASSHLAMPLTLRAENQLRRLQLHLEGLVEKGAVEEIVPGVRIQLPYFGAGKHGRLAAFDGDAIAGAERAVGVPEEAPGSLKELPGIADERKSLDPGRPWDSLEDQNRVDRMTSRVPIA